MWPWIPSRYCSNVLSAALCYVFVIKMEILPTIIGEA